MSVHPIFERLFADMARTGLLPPNTPPPIDLRAERIRREREASERRHDIRHPDPPEAA